MKILIIRFSSIGDIVLTTPVIRCVKTQLPGVELHYLTKKAFSSVLVSNLYIDKLYFLDDQLSDTIKKLKAEKFDLIVDLHHNLRTLLIKTRLQAKAVSFDKLNLEKWLVVNLKINILPKKHIVDRYLETVKSLGIKNDFQGLDYFLNSQYILTDLLPVTHHNYVGIVIGAQHFTKRLPNDQLIELCRKINTPIVLLGGKGDSKNGEIISQHGGIHVFNACGKFTLDQSAFIVKHAEKIITHDTGLMHIAAAFKKDISVIWGNTIPGFGMYPYLTSHKNNEVNGLSCRPCSKIGFQKCPKGHFKCMKDQNIDAIALFTKYV